jgi:hypothetical protein
MNPVRTSQKACYVSSTEHNRLMPCGETVAVCCKNGTEHTDTLWAVRTSQETEIQCVGSPYLTGNTSRPRYRAQPVNSSWGEIVAVCCENRTEYTDTLCGQSVPHTEHTYTLCGRSVPHTEHTDTVWAVRTSQKARYVSSTEHNRLMPCGETVSVCCENGTEHTDTLWAVRTSQETEIQCVGSPYLTGNTSRPRYRAQPVNSSWGEIVAVCCENRTEYTYTQCGQSVPHTEHTYTQCGQSVPHTEHTDTVWAVRTSHGTHIYTVWAEFRVLIC